MRAGQLGEDVNGSDVMLMNGDRVGRRSWNFSAGNAGDSGEVAEHSASDTNGLASIVFSTAGISGNVAVVGSATAGSVTCSLRLNSWGGEDWLAGHGSSISG